MAPTHHSLLLLPKAPQRLFFLPFLPQAEKHSRLNWHCVPLQPQPSQSCLHLFVPQGVCYTKKNPIKKWSFEIYKSPSPRLCGPPFLGGEGQIIQKKETRTLILHPPLYRVASMKTKNICPFHQKFRFSKNSPAPSSRPMFSAPSPPPSTSQEKDIRRNIKNTQPFSGRT